MNVTFLFFVPPFIGQPPSFSLAAFRTPLWLDDSLSEGLFHPYWAYWLVLFLAGLAIYYWGGGGNAKIRRAGLPLAIAALAWFLLGMLFVTPRQRLWNAHATIIAAAQHNDPQPIKDLLAPTFSFGPADRTRMSQQIDQFFHDIKIKSNTVRFFKATLAYPAAESQINLLTTLNNKDPVGAGPHLTKWLLEWTDTPNQDWQLSAIRRWYYGDQEMPNSLPTAP